MRGAVLSIALLLAACATAPQSFRSQQEIDAAIAESLASRPDDAETMARLSPGNVVRDGRMLVVKTGARTFRFVEEGLCEGFNTCARYRADRLFHGRYLGVSMVHGEYPDSYLIIDLARGTRMFDTGERPVPAPAAPLAAIADRGEMNEPVIGGLAVVDLERRRILWHRPDWYLEARIEAWEGPACVRASYAPGHRGEGNSRREVWIVNASGTWAAHESRPSGCNPT